ncbi:DUF6496 domain-containing protein [Prosthecobacter sp.]|uniref:DUF6496 domain-containing protein n=1 Tax=Prosthecobacter sp. TaxID=1965333 RepID=UPI003783E1C0
MPRKRAIDRAHRDQREGKSASTQAGEFVREEIELIRKGAHGVRNTRQAIAIGLSKARRAGVPLPPPKSGRVSEKTRRKAVLDSAKGRSPRTKPVSRKRSRATLEALRRESTAPVSKDALAEQTRAAARRRAPAEKAAAARKAVRTRSARSH